jgi:hypothetical protein
MPPHTVPIWQSWFSLLIVKLKFKYMPTVGVLYFSLYNPANTLPYLIREHILFCLYYFPVCQQCPGVFSPHITRPPWPAISAAHRMLISLLCYSECSSCSSPVLNGRLICFLACPRATQTHCAKLTKGNLFLCKFSPQNLNRGLSAIQEAS